MNWLFSFLQAISVYGIPSADQLVLGLARQMSESSAIELCREHMLDINTLIHNL